MTGLRKVLTNCDIGIKEVEEKVRELKGHFGPTPMWIFEDGVVKVPEEIDHEGNYKRWVTIDFWRAVQAAKAADVVLKALLDACEQMW